jgi:hypothetical protein
MERTLNNEKRKIFIREYGKDSDFKIVINFNDMQELKTVDKMLFYLAMDIDAQNYLISHNPEK